MKARTTGAYALIALGAVAVAVVAFSRGTALEAIFPVERARRAFSDKVWSRVKGACRGAAASAENVALRREVAALALAREDAARLEAENDRLRRALEYKEREPKTWLAAAVLVGGGSGPHGMLRVDKGSLAGVREGSIYPKGIAVGTLLEVRNDSDSPRREGEVLPAVDFATLRDVFIRCEK